MASGPVLILILILSIGFIILATARLKVHPFIVLITACFLVALAAGMPLDKIGTTISEGFGSILGNIGIVIVLGTIIGTILEKSGAAIKLADMVLKITGNKRPALGLSLIGYIVSIPVFCDSAYVILSSLKRSLIHKTGKPAVMLSVALATGLYASHTLVPPTPGPLAAAGNLNMTGQLGLVILFGLGISLVTMYAGNLWASYSGKKHQSGEDTEKPELDYEEIEKHYGKLPSGFKTLAPIFIPIILIALGSISDLPGKPLGTGSIYVTLSFLGYPMNALFIGFLFSLLLLPGFTRETLSNWIGKGIQSAGPIIIITGAGAAFGNVLKATQIGENLGQVLSEYNLGIFLPFIIAAALKTAQGSSTVALVTASALVAPLLPGLGLESDLGRTLAVMAVGAGAMTVSHANDSYFWVVSQFSKMDVATSYRTFSLATLIQGLVTVAVIYILYLALPL